MIVKVQLPIAGDVGEALVYNEDRSVWFLGPVTDVLVNAMEGEHKRFFDAHFEPDGKGGVVFHIDDDAPWQDW